MFIDLNYIAYFDVIRGILFNKKSNKVVTKDIRNSKIDLYYLITRDNMIEVTNTTSFINELVKTWHSCIAHFNS